MKPGVLPAIAFGFMFGLYFGFLIGATIFHGR